MRLVKLVTLVSTLGLIACGGSDPDPTQVDEPAPKTSQSDIVRKTGTVSWNLEQTDCPRDEEAIWGDGQVAEMEIDGDSIVLRFEIMPELQGQLNGDRATVTGTTIFTSDDEDVTCGVVGVTKLGQSSMEGQVSETLTSYGPLNCTSSGSFVVDFEP